MGIIKQLDQHVANLIAAGEVIERASSVVKELVENSIDANSTIINISLTGSGLKEIVVSDNGCGMDKSDVRMAFLPHATSKVFDPNDLFNISTLGFRGEALPSIISVSNFKIKTSVDGNSGVMIALKAGEITSEAIIAHPKGTEVTVKNLFFNTPARLQNLKSENVELSYITEYVSKIALANPHIAFKLTNNNKLVLQTFGNSSMLEVINCVYGLDVAKEMISITSNNGLFKVSGYVSKISISRSTKNQINIIVNGRVIKNNSLVNAVVEGYKTMLTVGRYPIAVIDIIVDPSLVDVNVHPAKHEVRFSDEDRLIELIKEAISNGLQRTNMIVDMDSNDAGDDDVIEKEENNMDSDFSDFDADNENGNISISKIFTEKEAELKEEEFNYQKIDNPFIKPEIKNEEFDQQGFTFTKADDIYKEVEVKKHPNPFLHEENVVYDSELEYKDDEEDVNEDDNEDDNDVDYITKEASVCDEKIDIIEEENLPKIPKLFYIGQLFGTYLLCQSEECLYIIDQHAANERINYEKILKDLKKDQAISYETLLPAKLSFTPAEALLVEEKMDEINRLGIKLEDFGGGTFTIREIPIWIKPSQEREFVEEIVTQIINGKKNEKYQFLDSIAKSLACKKSVKANEYLSEMQVEFLLENLENCNNPYTCPHGRPIIIKYSKYEIEKWFKRVV